MLHSKNQSKFKLFVKIELFWQLKHATNCNEFVTICHTKLQTVKYFRSFDNL